MDKEEGYLMDTRPVITRYPRCRALDLVFYPKGEPRVLDRDLRATLSPAQYQEWIMWSNGSTFDNLGIYAWDVERFLAGFENND